MKVVLVGKKISSTLSIVGLADLQTPRILAMNKNVQVTNYSECVATSPQIKIYQYRKLVFKALYLLIELTSWNSWTPCSRTCGTGERTRSRKCSDYASSKDKNNPCKENLFERETCNTQKCPIYTEWSGWSSCSVTCGGGRQERDRVCIQPVRAIFSDSFSGDGSILDYDISTAKASQVQCVGDPKETRYLYKIQT